MAGEHRMALKAAVLDRLHLINKHSWAWPDERDDIVLALQVFSLVSLGPADSEVDHPLVDLYRALHFPARTNKMVYLSMKHHTQSLVSSHS